MNPSLKKLWNDYGIACIIFLIFLVCVLLMLSNYFSSKGNNGRDKMSSNNNSAYNNKQPSGPQPSETLGQNETYASVNGQNPTQLKAGNFNKPNIQNPADLLPKDNNSQWAQLNKPSGNQDGTNFLKAGYHTGINTVGNSLRNANLQLRSEPPNPQLNVGPWSNTTIEPDKYRLPFEIGQQGQPQ